MNPSQYLLAQDNFSSNTILSMLMYLRFQDPVDSAAAGGSKTGVCAGENMLDSEETMMADEIWSSSWAGQLLDRCL